MNIMVLVSLTWICIMRNSLMHLILHRVEILIRSILQILLVLRSRDQNGRLWVPLPQILFRFSPLSLDLAEQQVVRLRLKLKYLMNSRQELQSRLVVFPQKTIISQQKFKVLVIRTQPSLHIFFQTLDQI